MYELIDFIVKSLLNPDEKYKIEVKEKEGVINLYVAKESIGKIIGKQGRIAKAIRALVKAAAIKNNIKANLEILELAE